MEINKTAAEIYAINKEHGFWDKHRNFGEMLMLCTSELSECLEADRKGKSANLDLFMTWQRNQIDRPLENMKPDEIEQLKKDFQEYIKDTWQDEIADAIIRLLDMGHGLGMDLETHIKLKMKYNSLRPKMHGKKY